MRYVGIDLHKRFLVVAVEDERGRPRKARRFDCREVDKVRAFFKKLGPFSAVIEASTSYRWLYELLEPLGNVILAHPLRLRAIVSGRAKTDKLDAALLAKLLRGGLIPPSYIPPRSYHELRELTRARARLMLRMTHLTWSRLLAPMLRLCTPMPSSNTTAIGSPAISPQMLTSRP